VHPADKRLFLSLIIAVFLHGLFLMSKLQQDTSQLARPLPVSTKKISISLHKSATFLDTTSREEEHLTTISDPQTDVTQQPTLFPVQVQHYPLKQVNPAPRPSPAVPSPRVSPSHTKQRIKQQMQKQVEMHQQQVPAKKPTDTTKLSEVQQSSGAAQAQPAGATVKATPLYKVNPAPMYPRLAWRRGLEGRVILDVYVDTDGSVIELKINRSSGHEILDGSAAEEVHTWLFQPGTVNGTPTPMWVQVPITYRLR
jgi:protein TonB